MATTTIRLHTHTWWGYIRLHTHTWWGCSRWTNIVSVVLLVMLPDEDEGNVIHMLPQDVEDACRIAKHLKMGVKEKDGEVHLEEAADWYTENNKIWLEEDLQEVLKVIGLEDLEAWKKKYNIVANNIRLKLDMLMTINNASEDIQKYIFSGYSMDKNAVDKFIKKTINSARDAHARE
jgi:hypothetical protein